MQAQAAVETPFLRQNSLQSFSCGVKTQCKPKRLLRRAPGRLHPPNVPGRKNSMQAQAAVETNTCQHNRVIRTTCKNSMQAQAAVETALPDVFPIQIFPRKNSMQAQAAVETSHYATARFHCAGIRKNSMQAQAAVETQIRPPNASAHSCDGKNSMQAQAAVETIAQFIEFASVHSSKNSMQAQAAVGTCCICLWLFPRCRR